MIKVVKYSSVQKDEWDNFVSTMDVSCFLFCRNYLEYHQDRFKDFSLLLYDNKQLKAILPGNRKGHTFFSHQGLTFGGILVLSYTSYKTIVEYIKSFFSYLKSKEFNRVIIKESPFFYNQSGNSSIAYVLNTSYQSKKSQYLGAYVNCSHHQFPKSSIEKRKLKLDSFNIIDHSMGFDEYWKILEYTLDKNYHTSPVHRLDEIKHLFDQFPNKIRVFEVRSKEDHALDAGALLYDNGEVVKMQYIACSERGRNNRATHAMYYSMINSYKSRCRYIDMGTCMNGANVNERLLYIKERFGAATYLQDIYEIEL